MYLKSHPCGYFFLCSCEIDFTVSMPEHASVFLPMLSHKPSIRDLPKYWRVVWGGVFLYISFYDIRTRVVDELSLSMNGQLIFFQSHTPIWHHPLCCFYYTYYYFCIIMCRLLTFTMFLSFVEWLAPLIGFSSIRQICSLLRLQYSIT